MKINLEEEMKKCMSNLKQGPVKPAVEIWKNKSYQEYMRMKYEMLRERINQFNINK